ncbi:MAG: hypothetical protein PHV51_05555, partial [Methanosarcinaceae archaeon]|nr:hypothetical protein [Methanosarcinaceae archaeon]
SGTYSFAGIYQMECMAESAVIGCDTQVAVTDAGPGGSSSVCRDLPDVVKAAGSSMVVSLCVTPGSATYYAIDECVPAGWNVTGASDGGDYISIPGHVKWVVTSGAVNKTYTYTVCIPDNISGTYSFTGIYQMEFMACSAAIGCDTQVNVTIYSNNSGCIMLYKGWNFVSVPTKLVDPCFANILCDLPVDAVLDYNAENHTWDSSMNLTWVPLKGYWIHATEKSFIPCERLLKKLPSTPPTLNLFEGWNTIGHCDSTDTLYAELVLENIDTKYTHIMGPWNQTIMNYTQCGYNGKTGIISGKHMGTDVFEMNPYEGYWLYMNETDMNKTSLYAPVGY